MKNIANFFALITAILFMPLCNASVLIEKQASGMAIPREKLNNFVNNVDTFTSDDLFSAYALLVQEVYLSPAVTDCQSLKIKERKEAGTLPTDKRIERMVLVSLMAQCRLDNYKIYDDFSKAEPIRVRDKLLSLTQAKVFEITSQEQAEKINIEVIQNVPPHLMQIVPSCVMYYSKIKDPNNLQNIPPVEMYGYLKSCMRAWVDKNILPTDKPKFQKF